MKQNAMQTYFSRKHLIRAENICIAALVVSALIAIFLPGGIPLGIPIAGVAGIVLIFVRAARVKDAEIDALVETMTAAQLIGTNSPKCIGTYDLSVDPIIKGKDGKLRTSRYVLTVIAEETDAWDLTVYTFDLLTASTAHVVYRIPLSDPPALIETTIMTPVGRRKRSVLCSPVICLPDGTETDIPVTTEDIRSSDLLADLCRS